MQLQYTLCRGLLTKGPFWDFLEEKIKRTLDEALPKVWQVTVCGSTPVGCLYVCAEGDPEEHIAVRLPDVRGSAPYWDEARQFVDTIQETSDPLDARYYDDVKRHIRYGMAQKICMGTDVYSFALSTDQGSEGILTAALLHIFLQCGAQVAHLNKYGLNNLFWERLRDSMALN